MEVDFQVESMATEGCLNSRGRKPEKKPLVCFKKKLLIVFLAVPGLNMQSH